MASQHFVQQIVQSINKANLKDAHYWSFVMGINQ